ncbi:MAG: DUF4397 domain-containing protein [Deltaproteobacteria bacterium]|nr:DUF4397 domain-containing protein [Deltaproteobacteria bacterium]
MHPRSIRHVAIARFSLFILCTLFAVGCSGGGEDSDGDGRVGGRVRFLNAVPELASIEISIDQKREVINLPYGQVSDYIDIDNPRFILEAFSSVSPLALTADEFSANEDESYILILQGDPEIGDDGNYDISPTIYLEESEDPADGRFFLRLIHSAPSVENSVEAFLTSGVVTPGILPIIEKVSFRRSSPYFSGRADDAVLSLFSSDGDNSRFVAETPVISYQDGDVVTAVLLDDYGRSGRYNVILISDRD